MDIHFLSKVINDLLKQQEWKFASTMKSIPHWYILEKNIGTDLFDRLSYHVKLNGTPETFYGKIYTYLYLDGYKYWVMKIKDGTGIINRAKISD